MKKSITDMVLLAVGLLLSSSLVLASAAPSRINSIQFPFIENHGQLDDQVLFYTPAQGGSLLIDRSGSNYLVFPGKDANSRVVIKEAFIGAKNTKPIGIDSAKTKISRYVGKDPKEWQANLPTWKAIGINDLYPGIDYQVRPLAQDAEKIFIIKPGANPQEIKLAIEGAKELALETDGSLNLHTDLGDLAFSAPVAYQEIDGQRTSIDVSYVLRDNSYSFKLGAYDKDHNLYIDPLVRATYYGGSDADYGYAIDVNESTGSVYITGYTTSFDLPTTSGAFQETKPGGEYDRDLFIARFDADLTTLEAATYYGDTSWQFSVGDIAVHPEGYVYIAGKTQGSDLPGTDSGYQPDNAGGAADAFIARFDADLSGPPVATYYGGTLEDVGISVAVNNIPGHDLYGHVYLAGRTLSEDLPGTAGGVQETIGGTVYYDAFVALFDANLQTLGQATYFGSALFDEPAIETRGKAITVEPINGDLVLVGSTTSPSLPGIVGGNHGSSDVFYVQLTPELQSIRQGAFFGGTGEDIASSMAIVQRGTSIDTYIAGRTKSTSGLVNATGGGYQTSYQGGTYDAFVLRHEYGITLSSTYLGSTGDERAHGIAIDATAGRVWVTGETYSDTFPTTANAEQVALDGYRDAFVAYLPMDLSDLDYSTYLGGSSEEYNTAIAMNHDAGKVYVGGVTSSSDLWSVDGLSYDNTFNGYVDAFVALFESKSLSSWVKDSVSFPGSNPDLAVDNDNNLYACYFNDNNAYVTRHDATTGDWSTLHVFPLPEGDSGFSDCSITVEGDGSSHTCIVTIGPTADDQPANNIWYLGNGIIDAIDINESPLDGAIGECDIGISNGMPTVSYTKYTTNVNYLHQKALAVAVKPSIATGWFVMDQVYPDSSSIDTHWSGASDFGKSTSISIDDDGMPLAAFTDEDGTASFFVPDDFPPFTKEMAETIPWTRFTTPHDGTSLRTHFAEIFASGRKDYLIESKSNREISIVEAKTYYVGDELVQNSFLDLSPMFSEPGLTDSSYNSSGVKLIHKDNNSIYYSRVDSLFSLFRVDFLGSTYYLIPHTTELVAGDLNNCAVASVWYRSGHALCENGMGDLVYYKQEYPDAGFLSVSPLHWVFGQEKWNGGADEATKEWRAFYLKNVGDSPLAIRNISIESDGLITPWLLDTSCDTDFGFDIEYAPGDTTAVCVRPDPAAYLTGTITARLVVETDNQTIVSQLEASPVPGADADSDGIPDQEEWGPDGDDPLFDGNGDGIPDSEQNYVTSFKTNYDDEIVALAYITLESYEGKPLRNVSADPYTPSFPTLSPGFAPWGAFTFEVELNCITSPPCGTDVKIYFHESALGIDVFPDSYYKVGPVTPGGEDKLYNFNYEVTVTGTGAVFQQFLNRIILYFIDGELGDHDMTVNYYIIDPGIPAVSYVTVLDALKQDVLSESLPAKLERFLSMQLDMAVKAIEADKKTTVDRVIRSLSKFIGYVEEEAGLAIPEETADHWVAIAQMMIDQLGQP